MKTLTMIERTNIRRMKRFIIISSKGDNEEERKIKLIRMEREKRDG